MIGRNFGRGLKIFEFRKLGNGLNYSCEINCSATTQKASKQIRHNSIMDYCKRKTREQDENSNLIKQNGYSVWLDFTICEINL